MMLRIIKSCLVSQYYNDLSNYKRCLILCDIIFEGSAASRRFFGHTISSKEDKK